MTKLIAELRQRHLEKYEEVYIPVSENVRGLNRDRGNIVRAANEAGWFVEEIEDVGDMLPADVIRLSDEIYERYKEVTSPPKKKKS